MKTFEHEVLTFGSGTKDDLNEMRNTLREWGNSGFEVIGVVQANSATPITVFLKRETPADLSANDEAA